MDNTLTRRKEDKKSKKNGKKTHKNSSSKSNTLIITLSFNLFRLRMKKENYSREEKKPNFFEYKNAIIISKSPQTTQKKS